MLVNVLVGISGVLVFLFVFWKRLKEDYSSGIIFESASYLLLGVGIFAALAYEFALAWLLWLEFFGALVGVLVSVFKLKIKFYEIFEALIISALPWLAFIFLKDSVVNSLLNSFLAFLVILALIFIFYYLDLHYRQFIWYKSGRVGFAGVSTLALIFLVRAILALFTNGVLSFVDRYEAIISSGGAFICFLMIFDLGRVRK